jgi:hypothetical protein
MSEFLLGAGPQPALGHTFGITRIIPSLSFSSYMNNMALRAEAKSTVYLQAFPCVSEYRTQPSNPKNSQSRICAFLVFRLALASHGASGQLCLG